MVIQDISFSFLKKLFQGKQRQHKGMKDQIQSTSTIKLMVNLRSPTSSLNEIIPEEMIRSSTHKTN